MNNPENFALTGAYQRGVRELNEKTSTPLAFLLPTTLATLQVATTACMEGARIVGGKAAADTSTAAQTLRHLQSGQDRPLFLVFSDQLLAAADATVRVRGDSTDCYISPFEFILNAKYGYELMVWTQDGFSSIPPAAPNEHTVFAWVVRYLDACHTQLDNWQVRHLQVLRTSEMRRSLASRKLRFYRSAVVNAYRDEPDSEIAHALLSRANALEVRYNEGVAA